MAGEAFNLCKTWVCSHHVITRFFTTQFTDADRQYLVGVEVIAPEPSDPADGLRTRHPVHTLRTQVGVCVAATGLRSCKKTRRETRGRVLQALGGKSTPCCKGGSSSVAYLHAPKKRNECMHRLISLGPESSTWFRDHVRHCGVFLRRGVNLVARQHAESVHTGRRDVASRRRAMYSWRNTGCFQSCSRLHLHYGGWCMVVSHSSGLWSRLSHNG